jgi:hypothetical protein
VSQQQFFAGSRRKLELVDWQPLMNEQSEKRIRLDLLMPLTGQAFIAMPEFVAPAYEKMDQENSAIKEVPLVTELEGMTFEAFSTDSSQFPIETEAHGTEAELGNRHVLLTGTTLRNFRLVRVTREKQTLVALKFNLTSKADAGLVLWAYKYQGGTFWVLFTETQPEVAGPEATNGDQMKLTEQPPDGKTQSDKEVEKYIRKYIKKHPDCVPYRPDGVPQEQFDRVMASIDKCAFPDCVLRSDHEGSHVTGTEANLEPAAVN